MNGLAEVLAAHRFTPTQSHDGTLNYGWCAGGDSYATKHIDEHHAHVAEQIAAHLAERLAAPEVRDSVQVAIEYRDEWVEDEADAALTAVREALTGGSTCHCGHPVTFGFDGDPTHHRGMCEHCDAVRCDAHPGACREALTTPTEEQR